ncbi:hypothetical protein [Geomonas sp.]|uniref:hypothetical protein n=1 Tax=Geomonas sp. TaxID=2651584 RepID=UPI002B485275|nr:hypothetical protein [Geomonas sp.]HJV34327.1 hypothetical protein [Geomonas sp.]
MKTIFRALATICAVALCGCGYSRIGYTVSEQQTVEQCNVPIKKKAHFREGEVKILGTVIAHDHYLNSEECDIEAVLRRVRVDACYLKADLINITYDEQPDYNWSICYRVQADLLKFTNPAEAKSIEPDPQYEWSKVQEQGAISREKGKNAYWKALGKGIIGGMP